MQALRPLGGRLWRHHQETGGPARGAGGLLEARRQRVVRRRPWSHLRRSLANRRGGGGRALLEGGGRRGRGLAGEVRRRQGGRHPGGRPLRALSRRGRERAARLREARVRLRGLLAAKGVRRGRVRRRLRRQGGPGL